MSLFFDKFKFRPNWAGSLVPTTDYQTQVLNYLEGNKVALEGIRQEIHNLYLITRDSGSPANSPQTVIDYLKSLRLLAQQTADNTACTCAALSQGAEGDPILTVNNLTLPDQYDTRTWHVLPVVSKVGNLIVPVNVSFTDNNSLADLTQYFEVQDFTQQGYIQFRMKKYVTFWAQSMNINVVQNITDGLSKVVIAAIPSMESLFDFTLYEADNYDVIAKLVFNPISKSTGGAEGVDWFSPNNSDYALSPFGTVTSVDRYYPDPNTLSQSWSNSEWVLDIRRRNGSYDTLTINLSPTPSCRFDTLFVFPPTPFFKPTGAMTWSSDGLHRQPLLLDGSVPNYEADDKTYFDIFANNGRIQAPVSWVGDQSKVVSLNPVDTSLRVEMKGVRYNTDLSQFKVMDNHYFFNVQVSNQIKEMRWEKRWEPGGFAVETSIENGFWVWKIRPENGNKFWEVEIMNGQLNREQQLHSNACYVSSPFIIDYLSIQFEYGHTEGDVNLFWTMKFPVALLTPGTIYTQMLTYKFYDIPYYTDYLVYVGQQTYNP